MKLRKTVRTFIALASVGAVLALRADPVIQFDDLPSNLTQVPNGYHVLGWNNVFIINGNTYSNNPSGFEQGVVSANDVIYGGGGSTASITAQMFDFLSAYATAAFNDNLQLEAKGYIDGTLVYDQTNTLSATAPTLIQFGFYGVDEVDLTSSGGTQHVGYPGSGTQFVMDNVSVKTWLPYVAPLAVNGGFETGDFTGWIQSGNLDSTAVVSTPTYVHSGFYGVQVGPSGTPGNLSQNIPTQIGHNYRASFWLENEEFGTNSFAMTCGGFPELSATNMSAFGWTSFFGDFLATRPNTTVEFQFRNDPSYFGFDDFDVTDISQAVANGGFETGDFTDWSQTGNPGDTSVSTTHWVGTYGAAFGPSGSPGYISQQVTTQTGQPYLISSWLQNSTGGGPNEFHASWSTVPGMGGTATTVSLADQTNLPAFGWTNLHYTVLADYFQNNIQFGFRNDPGFFYLDEVSAWPVPLIQNGSFEFGDFTGWTQSGNLGHTFVSTAYANEGFYGAQFGPVGSLGYLSQTIPTVPGLSYLIHCELYNSQPMTNSEFKVTWNGTVLMDTTNELLIGWLPFEFIIPATGTNAALQFGFRDDPSYLGLDNVSVTPLQSSLYITSITKTNSSADITWSGAISGYRYQLEYTTNLTQPNWTAVGNPLSPNNSYMNATDTNATDNQRFYRVLFEPPQLIF